MEWVGRQWDSAWKREQHARTASTRWRPHAAPPLQVAATLAARSARLKHELPLVQLAAAAATAAAAAAAATTSSEMGP